MSIDPGDALKQRLEHQLTAVLNESVRGAVYASSDAPAPIDTMRAALQQALESLEHVAHEQRDDFCREAGVFDAIKAARKALEG